MSYAPATQMVTGWEHTKTAVLTPVAQTTAALVGVGPLALRHKTVILQLSFSTFS